MYKKWLFPTLHGLVWTLIAVSGVRDFLERGNDYEAAWVRLSGHGAWTCGIAMVVGMQLVLMTGFYIAYGWIGPSLFPRPRYIRALAALVAACVAMVLVRAIVEFGILGPWLRWDNYFGRRVGVWWYTQNCILFSFDYVLFGVVAYFTVRAGRANQERTQAELSFLKSQVNPHFLFNTINDIYALVYQKSDEAPGALLKLSGLLRYMLYEDGREKVSLEKELAYLEDYLDLQRIGSGGRTYIDFRVEGDVPALRIAPLLLIPFAENIVKHGVIDDPSRPARLHVSAHPGRFRLSAVNAVRPRQKDKTGGIGLSNVRRRLELLYPGMHSFEVSESRGEFACILDLKLHP